VAGQSLKLVLDLANAMSWLSGKDGKLAVVVRHEAWWARCWSAPKSGILRKVLGRADSGGDTVILFALPRIVSRDAIMVTGAEHGVAKGNLRFALRPKPRAVTR
jgi:hypothetical protein